LKCTGILLPSHHHHKAILKIKNAKKKIYDNYGTKLTLEILFNHPFTPLAIGPYLIAHIEEPFLDLSRFFST